MKTLKYDVVVIGGGPSGVNAAIAAAREGSKTLLVERYGYLGGMLTNAGVGPIMTFHAGKTQVVRGIAEEIIQRLIKNDDSLGHMDDFVGYASSVTPFSTEGLKIVLETMALEAGVELLYHTTYLDCESKDGHIDKVKLFSKDGEFLVEGKVFIDASADADLAVDSNVSVQYGREADKLAQPMTMNAKVYNVDREKVREFLHKNVEKTFAKSHKVIDGSPRIGMSASLDELRFAIKNKDLSFNRETVLLFETINKGEFIINMSRIPKLSALDPFDLTKAEIEGRKQVQELLDFLQEYIPGFENCILCNTGPSIGIRESNKINGMYKLNENDLLNNKMFYDAIAMGGYPIDIHSPEGESQTEHRFLKPGSWYSIPYRSLLAAENDNLIVVGRCISTTHAALAAVRVTPIAMAIGQAGGTAAAICANNDIDVRKIDTDLLRKKLKKEKVFLEEYSQ